VAISQQVRMNVADKTRLYAEARRVLVSGGRLAIWDIVAGDSPEKLDFPMPWADRPELSRLVSAGQLRALIDAPGFVAEQWNDLTEGLASGRLRVVQSIARAVD
jgi:sarcosine/dimethylglycine N-methyltransferase